MNRLIELYKKTNGGHKRLSDDDFEEYTELRKKEYQDRRAELETEGNTNVKPCKDDSGDIIGWSFNNPVPDTEI